MTAPSPAAAAYRPVTAAPACRLPVVLTGSALAGAAARLAGVLDPGFLTEAGWDPVLRVLRLPAGHRLLGRTLCRVDGCEGTAHGTKIGGLCWRCFARLSRAGMSTEEIIASSQLPPLADHPAGCAVPGCLRLSAGGRPRQRTGLCQAHSRRFRRTAGTSMQHFLADPRLRPLPALGPCVVAACARRAESEHGYCPTHYVRWRQTVTAEPGTDQQRWRLTQPAVAEGGLVSLRGLPPLLVVQVLFGVQQRVREGAKLTDVSLRAVTDALRREQAGSIEACPADRVAGKPARSLHAALVREVRRALADPGSEQANDTWDLAIFGHPGRLSFTGIAQPWLRQAAKRWAAEELPRHRGAGASNVRSTLNALARLSDSLRSRPDHGDLPAALGRPDIENFLNRLAYLESAGTISRYHRNVICRGVRAALTGIRALGLTRKGQPAAGLPDVVALGLGDIPAEPVHGEPGRDLPPAVMAVLCANLDTLEPVEVKVATQIAIDTGRRPEDILDLPIDCLQHDADGAAVLVYDNAKANRLGRRLPISQATAAVITSQQHRIRGRFAHAPTTELRLLPAPRRNPDGRRPLTISMLEDRHRSWVAGLGTLSTSDGAEFDTTRIVPYAYRHPSSTPPGSSPTPTGTPTPNATPTPQCPSTSSPSYSTTETSTSPDATTGSGKTAAGRPSTRSPRSASTGTATGSGATPRRCWNPNTLATPSAKSPSPTEPAPNHPTSRPAAAPAPSGSAAPAATTSEPTSPTSPTCPPTSTTYYEPGNGSARPSTASTTGPAPTPPQPKKKSPASGGSSTASKATSAGSPSPNRTESTSR